MSNNKCLGFIETFGLAACVAAADAAVKSANVKLLGYEYAKGGGMCTVKVEGNVGACRAAIAAGNYDIMAAVMIGGMTPPIGIALSTLFFKNRFTKSEQQTTVTNFIMGMSFITEGAIPFAASDPLRIIPPCVVGSAVAGALSMAFGCGSRAPHGGLFVIGIIENAPMFLVALIIGAVITMAGIVLLKKPLNTEK